VLEEGARKADVHEVSVPKMELNGHALPEVDPGTPALDSVILRRCRGNLGPQHLGQVRSKTEDSLVPRHGYSLSG
jgi:hypothetical protein